MRAPVEPLPAPDREDSLAALGRLVPRALGPLFLDKAGQILLSTVVLILLWGAHGRCELLRLALPGWTGPGSDPRARSRFIPWVPWDHELISFALGALLLVVVPMALVKLVFREPLAAYGLGLPPAGRRCAARWVFALLLVLSLPAFWAFAHDPEFQRVYPFYRRFAGWGEFAAYEVTYIAFFVAIEFIFRGYLLFGLAGTPLGRAGSRFAGQRDLPGFALLIQMLPYTAWHLGKPTAELWGTLFWGFASGLGAWAARSIWPVVAAHWLLNVFMDALIWRANGG